MRLIKGSFYSFVIVLIVFMQSNCHSQSLDRQLISPLGINSTEISSSLGEPVIQTHQTDNLIVTQGFEQTNLSEEVTTGLSFIDISHSLLIYPNPAKEVVTIEFDNYDELDLRLDILDLKGQLMDSYSNLFINTDRREINFSTFPDGQYVLHLYSDNGKYRGVTKVAKTNN